MQESIHHRILVKSAGFVTKNKPIMAHQGGRVLNSDGLMYVVAGKGSYEDWQTEKTEIMAGSVFAVHAGRWHNFDPHPDSSLDEYWVLFDWNEVLPGFDDLRFKHGNIHQIGIQEELIQAYQRLVSLFLSGNVNWSLRGNMLLHRILMDAYTAVDEGPLQTWDGTASRAIAWMQRFIREPAIDIRAYAESQHMSYENFRKIFRKEMGCPPHQYYLKMKIRAAQQGLLTSRNSIKTVADDAGFGDTAYFCRLFRKISGMSPEKYRSLHIGLCAR
ncbi:MAG: helix-turn-helix transcriptional regulator [Planctomycetes bacterium]|nr:helix-turn-helix transcriptional regulator [Planctomycetota bacterium]